MSVKVTGMVFERYPEGGGELLLALALADHAYDDGTSIFPSIARLAAKTRQSERSVQYQLRKMEKSGWLVLVNAGTGGRRRGTESGGKTREYRINPAWMNGAEYAPLIPPVDNLAKGAESAPFDGAKGAIGDGKGCNLEQERVQSATGKGATAIAPESSVNHQEPSENHQGAPATCGKPEKPFDRFWSAWPSSPRKVGKVDCERRWKREHLDAKIDEIICHVEAMKGTQQWKDGFEPAPATYLNQKRWNDGVPADQPRGADGSLQSSRSWWADARGIEDKAMELGMAAKPQEPFWRFKVRVFKRAGDGPWRDELLADMQRTKNQAYVSVHEYFYGHPPVEAAA